MAHIKKPAKQKAVPLTSNSADKPVEMGKQEIHGDMGRTRTGIQHSPEVWGDRVWGSDRKHPHAKPSR